MYSSPVKATEYLPLWLKETKIVNLDNSSIP